MSLVSIESYLTNLALSCDVFVQKIYVNVKLTHCTHFWNIDTLELKEKPEKCF